jgi:signal transduction histidine kinase
MPSPTPVQPLRIGVDDRITVLFVALVGVFVLVDLGVMILSPDLRGVLFLPVWAGSVAAVVVARWSIVAAVALQFAGSALLSVLMIDVGRRAFDWVHPVNLSELAAIGVLLLCGVRALPTSLAAGVSAVGGSLLFLMALRFSGSETPFMVAAYGSGFAVCLGAGAYLRWLDAARRTGERLARESERSALARELHDVVAHHVTGIALQAQAARLALAVDPAAAGRSIDAIESAAAEALRSMRSMVGALRVSSGDAPLAPTATADDIRALASTSADSGIAVRVAVAPGVDLLPAPVVATLHRIAMEAVSNARRHAVDATAVDVQVTADHSTATVTAADDGVPRLPAPGGFGLVGIAERVEALGGHFRAGSRPGRGWELVATVRHGGGR